MGRHKGMNYKINKQDTYWEIEAEKVISIEDCCYDVTTNTYVIASKHNKGGDYIIINSEHEILQIVSENQGLNRKFILAPDKSVWIGMSALNTKKGGEVVLPLYERNRVGKEIVKSDLGVDFGFYWNGCYWGYINDIWGDKPDKMLQYQFDSNGLYKTRKAYKLDILCNAAPFIDNDNLYLCQKGLNKENDNEEVIQIYKITEPDKPEEMCNIIFKGEFYWCRLINADESGYKIIVVGNNDVHMLSVNRQGEILEEKQIYEMADTEFYSIMDFKVSKDGAVAFVYVSENQAGIIEIRDSVAKKAIWQIENVLYSKDTEIKTDNKFAFHIMSDGSKNYYMATNIDSCEGKSRKIYLF